MRSKHKFDHWPLPQNKWIFRSHDAVPGQGCLKLNRKLDRPRVGFAWGCRCAIFTCVFQSTGIILWKSKDFVIFQLGVSIAFLALKNAMEQVSIKFIFCTKSSDI